MSSQAFTAFLSETLGHAGRPRRTNKQRAEELMLQEAYRLVTVRDGDGTARIPAFRAVLRAQIALAAKGNGPAQRSVQRSLQKIEAERHAQSSIRRMRGGSLRTGSVAASPMMIPRYPGRRRC